MSIDREKYGREVERRNMSDEVTGDRIYENLQIDGEQPPLSKIRQIIAKIKGRTNGQRTPKSSK